jgi:hypothetical protein
LWRVKLTAVLDLRSRAMNPHPVHHGALYYTLSS